MKGSVSFAGEGLLALWEACQARQRQRRAQKACVGYLMAQEGRLLLVGARGRDRFPKARLLRQVGAAEALQMWGLSIPKSACAQVLRHTA